MPHYGQSSFHSKFRKWSKDYLSSQSLLLSIFSVTQIRWTIGTTMFKIHTNRGVLYCRIANLITPEEAITQ